MSNLIKLMMLFVGLHTVAAGIVSVTNGIGWPFVLLIITGAAFLWAAVTYKESES
jgi:hypothetical protein